MPIGLRPKFAPFINFHLCKDPSVPPPDFEEFRVYRYSENPLEIEFILTEERPLTDFFREYTFDYRQGLLTLAQLLQPDIDNVTTVNLILRTIDSKGGDTRTFQKLFLDLPFDVSSKFASHAAILRLSEESRLPYSLNKGTSFYTP